MGISSSVIEALLLQRIMKPKKKKEAVVIDPLGDSSVQMERVGGHSGS